MPGATGETGPGREVAPCKKIRIFSNLKMEPVQRQVAQGKRVSQPVPWRGWTKTGSFRSMDA